MARLGRGRPNTRRQPQTVVRLPLAETLTDTFDGQDTTKWVNWAPGSVAVSGGNLVLTTSASYPSLQSAQKYDIIGSYFGAEFTAVPTQATGTSAASAILVQVDTNNAIILNVQADGSAACTLKTAGVSDATYPARPVGATHYRIRVDYGRTITWEALVSGTWTTLRTGVVLPTSWGHAFDLFLQAGYWNAADTGVTPAQFASAGIYTPPVNNTAIRFGAGTSTSPATTAEFDSIQSIAGRRPSINLIYRAWTQTITTADLNAIRANGADPFITWEAWDGVNTSTTNATYTMANVIAGNFDTYLTQTAQTLKAWSGTVYLRPFHEMNGNWYPWCVGVNGNTAQQHKDAWAHVRAIFTSVGANNVKFVWSPNTIMGTNTLSPLYPGDTAVDVIAVDGYNFGVFTNPDNSTTSWIDPVSLFAPTFAELRTLTSTEPFWIGETSSAETGGSKATWITSLFDWMKQQPELAAFVWFDINKERDWRIESSTASQTAFASKLSELSTSSTPAFPTASPADTAALTDSVSIDVGRGLTTTAADVAAGSDATALGFGPTVVDAAVGSDAASFTAGYGPSVSDTAALSDVASQVQTQFTTPADTAAGSDDVGIGFAPATLTEFAAIQADVKVDWGQSSSTGSLVAAGTSTTTGTTWASTTNANGAADGTLATYTGTATGSILLAGYNAQTAIGAQPSSLTNVDVTVTYKVATTSRWSAPTVQLYSGTTAIGSAITLPAATTTLTGQTVRFSTTNLPTWAQLSDLRVQVTAVKNGATSDVFSLDAATAVISYINVVSPLQFNAYNPPIPTESVLATEAVDQLRTVFNTNADTASGTDALTPVQDTVRLSADTAQGTDTATAIRGLPLVSLADTAAGMDTATTVTGIQRAPADTAQGTDTCSYVLNTVRVAADTAALTDPITALKQTLAGPDTAKLTDSISVIQKIVRTPADTVTGTDTHTEGGTATYVLGSTAVVETTSHIGVREVHKLKATILVGTDVQGTPVRGPQRMPVDLTVTGNLAHRRALEATVTVETTFSRAKFRIVRSMRDTTRMPPEDRVPARSVHLLTNIPEPELSPLTIEDEEFLALETVAAEPVRYGRTFAVLRS